LRFSLIEVERTTETLLIRLLLSWIVGVIDRHKIFKNLVGVNSLNWEECRVSHLYDWGFVPFRSVGKILTYRYQAIYRFSGTTRTAKRAKFKSTQMLKRMDELAKKRAQLANFDFDNS